MAERSSATVHGLRCAGCGHGQTEKRTNAYVRARRRGELGASLESPRNDGRHRKPTGQRSGSPRPKHRRARVRWRHQPANSVG